MRIEFTSSAITDLENIKAYYQEKLVPQIGEKFLIDIISHIEKLPDNPKIGRVVPEFQASHIRELIHPPFRLVYMLNTTLIQIVRIWRSERLLLLP